MRWLQEYLGDLGELGSDPRLLAERLSMTGTEVERIVSAGAPSAEGYVIAKVLSAEPHPNADRLRVCTVDAGGAEPRTIVCGAPNVAAGQTVAVVLPGAELPNGTKIGEAKLRGVESAGMILSETEMELGEDANGIAELTAELGGVAAGTPLSEHVAIADTVLELEITPNRPDCLGVYGVAREIHAFSGASLAPPPWEEDAEATGEGEASDHASVTVEVPELCPRFTARVFTDVEVGPSPLWLKARLVAAGQRPINNVVDITNYVMLLTGQPLHSFDLDRVPGGELTVRLGKEGEKLTTLDEVERVVDPETVLVCDREGPTAIAGIMGGGRSEVSGSTARVLLEVASWDGTNVLRSSNMLALRSEASTRFEKGIHPALTMRAQRIASRLMVELCGARLVPGTIDVDAKAAEFELHDVTARQRRIDGLLGMAVAPAESREHLRRLGFDVQGVDGSGEEQITVTVPPDRHFDIVREVDLIEEIARVHGLDEHLPATLPARTEGRGRLLAHQKLLRRIEDLLRDSGLDEAISWSFVDRARGGIPGLAAIDPVIVHNPLSADQAAMRTDLIGGLLTAAHHNLARGADRLALFESGRVYLPERPAAVGGSPAGAFAGDRPAVVAEPHRLAALIIGPLRSTSWRDAPAAADFYDAKGLLELLAGTLGVGLSFAPGGREFLHPAKAATVSLGGRPIGWIGELHPSLLDELGIRAGVAFEIDAAPLLSAATAGEERYEDVMSHPAVIEDLSVVAGDELSAADVETTIRDAGGELLRSVEVFDLYEGEQVGEGKRSVSLRLEFQAAERTLTDAEVAESRSAIVDALAARGGELRG